MTLTDGSTVTLGPKTALALTAPRQAHLLQGIFRHRAGAAAFPAAGRSMRPCLAGWAVRPVAGAQTQAQVGAWRDDFLIARDESLASVAARIARWLPGKVVIASPSPGARRISGIYGLRDPLAALQAAVRPTGGQVRQVTRLMTVISAL